MSTFGDFTVSKKRSSKCDKNSAHPFGDNYLTIHFVKFLEDRITL